MQLKADHNDYRKRLIDFELSPVEMTDYVSAAPPADFYLAWLGWLLNKVYTHFRHIISIPRAVPDQEIG